MILATRERASLSRSPNEAGSSVKSPAMITVA
jgi:hypothetical protein